MQRRRVRWWREFRTVAVWVVDAGVRASVRGFWGSRASGAAEDESNGRENSGECVAAAVERGGRSADGR